MFPKHGRVLYRVRHLHPWHHARVLRDDCTCMQTRRGKWVPFRYFPYKKWGLLFGTLRTIRGGLRLKPNISLKLHCEYRLYICTSSDESKLTYGIRLFFFGKFVNDDNQIHNEKKFRNTRKVINSESPSSIWRVSTHLRCVSLVMVKTFRPRIQKCCSSLHHVLCKSPPE